MKRLRIAAALVCVASAVMTEAWAEGEKAPSKEANPPALSGDSKMANFEEIKRRSRAQEPENGFCATTGWGFTPDEEQAAFYDAAVAGAYLADRFGDQCFAHEVMRGGRARSGGKCVVLNIYHCLVGKDCFAYSSVSERSQMANGTVRWLASDGECQ